MNIVYTNIAKAFDSVCHPKLISVLSSLGISGKMLKWINSFLNGQVQFVCVNNCFSSFLPAHSGAPQGSILSPLLFVVLFDEVIKVSELYDLCGGMDLYADDAKLFSNNVNDLQSSLSRISAWFVSVNLFSPPVNVNICVFPALSFLRLIIFVLIIQYSFSYCC